MCGICGFTGRITEASGGRAARETVLADMMQALRHRGPDDAGTYLDEAIALGFQRLSIVDLEGGAQPMKNEDGHLFLVFNGEIYNQGELRWDLAAAGHRFRSRCDAEVVLHGYEEWGEKLLPRLRGMFAFVIWDAWKKELFAARDGFGIKPLYYTLLTGQTSGGGEPGPAQTGPADDPAQRCRLVFASEIKAILKHPAYTPRLNEEALAQYLSFQYSALEESFFKGIYRLEPGSYLRWRLGSAVIELHHYFEPALAPAQDSKSRRQSDGAAAQEWAADIDAAITETAAAHAQADVEIGAFLSGGVDSALLAKKLGAGKTYTVGFGPENCHYNEMAKAREAARLIGGVHRERRIGEAEFWEAVPQVLYYLDEPSGDASAVALWFLAEEAAKEVKAVVSGEGADELFGGYRIYCEPEALRRFQRLPAGFRRRLAALAKRLPEGWKGRSFLLRGSRTLEERFIGNANIFSFEERNALLLRPARAVSPQKLLAEDYRRMRWRDMRDADCMQEIDLRHWLPGDILQKADRMSMAHSLEVRVPYLDRQVFALAKRLPGSLKQRGAVTKYALRRAARRELGASVSARPKLGFPVPIRVWLRGEEGYLRVKEVFGGRAAQQYFHTERLLELLEEHRSGRKDNSRKIWTVYAFCVWYAIYFPQD